jgi:hypothetical protein
MRFLRPLRLVFFLAGATVPRICALYTRIRFLASGRATSALFGGLHLADYLLVTRITAGFVGGAGARVVMVLPSLHALDRAQAARIWLGVEPTDMRYG